MSLASGDLNAQGIASSAAPRVDVLIPVFNAASTVASALASIQNQTMSAIRIVVVDDGSTDETPAILAAIVARDPRVLVLSQPNGGIVEALNRGLTACTAPFVARHDADDLAAPTRLAEQVAFLDANPECIAVGGSARHIDEHGRELQTIARFGPPETSDPALAPAREPYLLHPFLMARRLELVEIGGYRYVYHAEDADLYWRLQEKGTLRNTPELQGFYRMHSGSISGSSIVNGRLMALYSQLAAISAMRRRAGKPDLSFDRARQVRARQKASSLVDLHTIGSEGLEPAEADHLSISMSGKLLEICSYRPYELEGSDCAFLRSAAIEHWASLSQPNRKYLDRMYSGASARLLRGGRFRDAMQLAYPRTWPMVLARLALRVVFPPKLHQSLQTRFLPLLTALRA